MPEAAPVLPDYEGACVSGVVPALLEPGDAPPTWMPEGVHDASQVVLLLLDGLGWTQLRDRLHLAPTLASMTGGPVRTVVPSTTATALTSISTGLAPGDHGIVGYRLAAEGDVLNVLRWSIPGRDAREAFPPAKAQPVPAFCSQRPAIVTRAEFASSGFTQAHLEGARFNGYRCTSTLVTEVRRLLGAHESFVYAYYDGVDKVAHEYGLADHYDAEVRFVDAMCAELIDSLPPGAALLVVSDHGQVDVGPNTRELSTSLTHHVELQSGEGRFRWLHARPGHDRDLLAVAEEQHGDEAWVVSLEQTIDEHWFGPRVSDAARQRLGDVALVARADVAFLEPADTGPYELLARHGSLTEAEMLVPLLAHVRH